MRQTAAQRVAESWGGVQTTAGVLLAIPVETSRVVIEQSAAGRETQRTEVERNVLYVLPDTLKVDASAEPDHACVGLYETPVYTAHVQISASSPIATSQRRLQEKEGREVKWNEARLLVLNSESRALRAVDDLVVAGESLHGCGGRLCGFGGHFGRGAGGGTARERVDSISREAHARRQQPAHVPAAGAQGGHRAEVDVAASEVRRRAGAARTEDRQRWLQRALVGAGNQPQFRPELV